VVNIKHDIKPISYIKTNAADIMKYVTEVRNPVVITQNGEAKAVLIDVDSYQNMQDAFNLLQILQISENDIKHGRVKSSEQVFSDIEKKFGF
jgi:prevent-host-death family protein